MRAYLAFVKKEFTENLRTYKFMIMLAVFLIFGIMSPLLAKLTPELLKGMGTDGMVITIPEPTAIDSWTQFFKNVGQMGILVVVIIFAGIMANEFSRGTLVNILTKGMKRHTVILSKFTVASVIWTLSYLLSIAVTYGYTIYFWDNIKLYNVFSAFFSMWMFGILLIALLILGGVMFKTFSGSLLLCGGIVIVMFLLNIVPKVQKYNPATLLGDNIALLVNVKTADDTIPAMIVCGILIILLMMSSIIIFNKKQL